MLVSSIILSLLQNAAILMSFILLYDYFWVKDEKDRKRIEKFIAGIFISLIGTLLMLSPWEMGSGIFFDTRSILIAISGVFLGPLPTIIATIILSAIRYFIGGTGVFTGVTVLVSSALIGLFWHKSKLFWKNKPSWIELLALGFAVHITMLACILFLPKEAILHALKVMFLPIILIYPFGTMLMGLIMLQRAENRGYKSKLTESRALYFSLVNHMPAGVFRKTKEGRYDYVNARFCELKGLTEEEIIGKNPKELADYEEKKKAMGLYASPPLQRTLVTQGSDHHEWIMRHGMPIVVEESYTRQDGQIEYFQVVKTPIFDAAGNVVGSQGMQFDISKHKQTEDALLSEQYLLRSFMDNTPDLIYFKDLESRFIRLNKAHIRLLGSESEARILGKTDFDFFTAEHARQAFDDEQTIIRTGKSIINIEEKETWQDGHVTWAITSKFPLKDKEGVINGTFGVSKDITAQKTLERDLITARQKAEESDRLKTAFLHNISHEIRTPMNAIMGFTGFLVDPDIEPDKRAHFSEVVIQSSKQLLSIIDDIVRIASIEAGQEKITDADLTVNVMMNFLYEQFISKAEEKGLEFKFIQNLDDKESRMIADDTKLMQILSNLLVNAFKFTKVGHVHFGYQLKHDFVEFFVEDTGIGIPEDMQESVFNRFSQVESSISRQYGGSGLGLSICKAYVDLLGGKIWLRSKPGQGSSFRFTIPYRPVLEKKMPPEIKQEVVLPVSVGKSATFLIAEDEDLNFMLVRELLRGFNLEIIRAVNGEEAVQIAISNNKIDLILMDLKMPMMDGYEATRAIKAYNPSIPIIALTAYSLESDRNKALSCGCFDVIVKPVNKQELYTKLDSFLKKTDR